MFRSKINKTSGPFFVLNFQVVVLIPSPKRSNLPRLTTTSDSAWVALQAGRALVRPSQCGQLVALAAVGGLTAGEQGFQTLWLVLAAQFRNQAKAPTLAEPTRELEQGLKLHHVEPCIGHHAPSAAVVVLPDVCKGTTDWLD